MSRNRIGDAHNGGLSDGELQAAIAMVAPLRLSVSFDQLKEQVNDAIINYSVAFELASANTRARDQQRERLKRAVGNLLKIAHEGETRALVQLLQFYPATVQLLGRPSPERIGSLPLEELIESLQQFSDALENRVFGDDLNLPEDDDVPAFPTLVGVLWEAFDASLVEIDGAKKEAKFDGFARNILQAAGVKPVNGAPFAATAIKDALRTHRARRS